MVKDAESNAEEDRKRRERIDVKNTADSVVYQAQTQLADLNGQVSDDDKQRVEALANDLREAIDKEDTEQMKSLTSDIQQAMMQIGNAVYANASASSASASSASGTTAEASSSSAEDDVIDADFV